MKPHGYCPYRIQMQDLTVGCTVREKKVISCYSQELQPLISQNEEFYCPKQHITISQEIYIEIEEIINRLITIQDRESISYNLRPILKGTQQERLKYI